MAMTVVMVTTFRVIRAAIIVVAGINNSLEPLNSGKIIYHLLNQLILMLMPCLRIQLHYNSNSNYILANALVVGGATVVCSHNVVSYGH